MFCVIGFLFSKTWLTVSVWKQKVDKSIVSCNTKSWCETNAYMSYVLSYVPTIDDEWQVHQLCRFFTALSCIATTNSFFTLLIVKPSLKSPDTVKYRMYCLHLNIHSKVGWLPNTRGSPIQIIQSFLMVQINEYTLPQGINHIKSFSWNQDF